MGEPPTAPRSCNTSCSVLKSLGVALHSCSRMEKMFFVFSKPSITRARNHILSFLTISIESKVWSSSCILKKKPCLRFFKAGLVTCPQVLWYKQVFPVKTKILHRSSTKKTRLEGHTPNNYAFESHTCPT